MGECHECYLRERERVRLCIGECQSECLREGEVGACVHGRVSECVFEREREREREGGACVHRRVPE